MLFLTGQYASRDLATLCRRPECSGLRCNLRYPRGEPPHERIFLTTREYLTVLHIRRRNPYLGGSSNVPLMASTMLAVLAAGVTPILVIALVIFGTGFSLVLWQPPNLWTTQFGTPNARSSITVLSGDASALYAGGYVGGPEWPDSHPSPSYLDTISTVTWSGRKASEIHILLR